MCWPVKEPDLVSRSNEVLSAIKSTEFSQETIDEISSRTAAADEYEQSEILSTVFEYFDNTQTWVLSTIYNDLMDFQGNFLWADQVPHLVGGKVSENSRLDDMWLTVSRCGKIPQLISSLVPKLRRPGTPRHEYLILGLIKKYDSVIIAHSENLYRTVSEHLQLR